MPVDVIAEDDRWAAIPLEEISERAASATLERLGLEPSAWEVALLACDDARIADLNGQFRGRAAPTNVLSWPSEERGAAIPGETPHAPDLTDPELGDIAMAFETCEREAREMGKDLPTHVTHLVVHGILHLLGYDHVRDEDAALMEGLESEILGKLGLPDPYG
ncbi:rRNA maturation RNase YbeY [Histidinibacterium aquaticum]|uniref:Endoribonuclease YbeY n=1 Tax=Histidinibacterium aquaticum TaxID=2613962 RepID=A0A5J5GJI3_9RHOB|nr:rRNA maturation RNase YbeY [Histidinibacterium aquaticum]KAA9008305.1 rRNA maturation RNase YbeY [Histidinibacterium aquaticum]